MKYIKLIAIISLLSLVLTGCGDPKIDTSTVGSYEKSLQEVRSSLPLDKLNEFNLSIQMITFINNMNNSTVYDMNGKTGLEIIAAYNKLIQDKTLIKNSIQDPLRNITKGFENKLSQNIHEVPNKSYKANVNDLVINITNSKGREKLMKISIEMESSNTDFQSIIDSNRSKVIDTIIRLINSRSSEELLTVGGKALLKEEIKENIARIINTPVDKLYFRDYVIK